MAVYKLIYFPLKGRAHTIRLLFALTGIEYEDHRIPFNEWPHLKPSILTSKLPCLEAWGRQLCGSTTIARYVSTIGGLRTECDFQNALIDSIVDVIESIFDQVLSSIKAPGKLKDGDHNMQEKIATTLEILTKFLEDKEYFVDKKISQADVHFYSVCEILNEKFGGDFLDAFPALKSLYWRVASEPGIKHCLQSGSH